jgi:ATPase subunit of ABC transporter with duplicated ATPase domains
MLHLQQISKSFAGRTLFDDVTVGFQPGHRYGLTGPNGAGKSTLLKIITGDEEPDGGQVSRPDRVGILRQEIAPFREMRAIDVVVMGNDRLWAALTERDRLYEGEITDEVGMRLGDLEGVIAEEDGYSAEAQAEEMLTGLGIPQERCEETMGSLPTDLQFRVLLGQALFGEPQLLLLDEPTNHLDMTSITWLEGFLHEYKGVLIVVSHDRHFLNAVTTQIADIDYETVILYPGNYDDMITSKTSIRERAESDVRAREKKIDQLKEFIAKFGSGTRASSAKSRQKEIQRLQPQDLKKSNIERPYIRFQKPENPSGQIVYRAVKLSKGFDEPVIDKFSLEVQRGEKIGVIGRNGLGKTTLLKLFADKLAADDGKVVPGHQVTVAYFPQNHDEVVDKESEEPIFDWLKNRHSRHYDEEIRGVLGKLLFGGNDAFKPLKALSGGETARLLLGDMMLSNVNVLILDEPNNHLDLEAVSALAWGLDLYEGTVLLASHDRDLMGTVASKLIALDDDGATVFDGTLEEYLEKSV